jgi:hypothetical protein
MEMSVAELATRYYHENHGPDIASARDCPGDISIDGHDNAF